MTGTIASIGLVVILGLPAGRLYRRSHGPAAAAAISFLAGSAVWTLALLTLSLFGVEWSVPAAIALSALYTAMVHVAAWRKADSSKVDFPYSRTSLLTDFALVALIAAHARYVLSPSLWDWAEWLPSRRDFFFIWGMKGRLFFEHGGIPWDFLRAAPNDLSHFDYPPLVPLLFAGSALFDGQWNAPSLGLFDTAFGAAVLLVCRAIFLKRRGASWREAFAVLAISGSALLPWPGFAESAMVAYATVGVLLLRDALRDGSSLLAPALLTGCAGLVKNEGVALIVVVLLAFAATHPRRLPHVLPGLLPPSVWIACRFALGLRTDLFAGDLVTRASENLGAVLGAVRDLSLHRPLFWGALTAGLLLLVLRRVELRSDSLLWLIVSLQLSVYLAMYVITPLAPEAHIVSSWSRITTHVAILFAVPILERLIGLLAGVAVSTGDLRQPSGTPEKV